MGKTYDSIYIKGARVHNLKNITLEIPHEKLVVITGLSGSGKSTLAFDTIFAEGQRRYVESLSAYARQFLGRIDKPDVDLIEGIAPAIAIQQQVSSRNPRSTVGTATETYDYLKLLFARVGHTISPVSGREIRCFQVDDIVVAVARHGVGAKVMIASPLVVHEGQTLVERLTLLLKDGFERLWVDGAMEEVTELLPHVDSIKDSDSVSVIVDRVVVGSLDDADFHSRLADSVTSALDLSNGVCRLIALTDRGSESVDYSTRFEADGITFTSPTEHLFSFNNPIGACPVCDGYGKVTGIDEDLVVPDKNRSIYDDAIACWKGETMRRWRDELLTSSDKFDFPVHEPYYRLTTAQKQLLWLGNDFFHGLNDFFAYLKSESYKIQFRVMLSRYTGKTLCPACGGARLRPEALYVKVCGLSIAQMAAMNVDRLLDFFDHIELEESEMQTVSRVLVELRSRLRCLSDVGLGYLTLDRLMSTLSGGETQRINLSSSLGSNLTGSLYILDEPSIGLHPRDTHRLIDVLKQLRDMGNTVIVVEHEEEVIRAADWIVDIGPRAGINGGEVMYNGPIEHLCEAKGSLTADYLAGRRKINKPSSVRGWSSSIVIGGARENNLKGIDVRIPLGVMTCVTGVSGSGKSSLVESILYPALRRMIYETGIKPGSYESLTGDTGLIKSVELIDQNPIGTSLRSNPVTYTKAYNAIRDLYASLPYSVHNGLNSSSFSFNRAGGRCEECQGEGTIKVSMQFMADVELKCEHCGGKRFKEDVLEAKYRGQSIYDVLEMSVDEAVTFFSEEKTRLENRRIIDILGTLQDVGLGYIKLGQSTSTLSGGEIQRIKLASFLMKEGATESTMFIFDEPTTGLHFHDINRLLKAFDALIKRGHTIVVVEHNMDIIKCADWVIDLGPEAGEGGGELVFEGTPAALSECKESYTGKFLSLRSQSDH